MDTLLTVTCENCGAEIDQSRSRGNLRAYCSGACRTKACRARRAQRLAERQSEQVEQEPPRRRLVHRSDQIVGGRRAAPKKDTWQAERCKDEGCQMAYPERVTVYLNRRVPLANGRGAALVHTVDYDQRGR